MSAVKRTVCGLYLYTCSLLLSVVEVLPPATNHICVSGVASMAPCWKPNFMNALHPIQLYCGREGWGTAVCLMCVVGV